MKNHNRKVQYRRLAGLPAIILAIVLSVAIFPKTAWATDYTISDGDSCTASLAAIEGEGDAFYTVPCYIYKGTLSAGDSLTVTGTTGLRPQRSNGGKAKDFVNYGTITMTGPLYNAGRLDNYGTIYMNTLSQNYGTINNFGTIIINAEFYNAPNGALNNFCGGTITITANIVGGPVVDKCNGQ